MKNKKKANARKKSTLPKNKSAVQPFIVHIRELRQRLIYIVLTLLVFSGVGYLLQERIIMLLLRPAHDQKFIYTSPGGGFSVLVNICLYFGLIVSLPLIMYHLFSYLEPLLRHNTRKFIVQCAVFSTILGILGVLFGYFIGLPAALTFLLHQFRTDQIQPLLAIQSYLSFVMVYLIGFAILFQIPLILLFINRIKRLRPRKLFSYQRYVIAGAFVLAAVITPSGDAINQFIMAGPIVAMYQIGILAVWLHNRHSKSERITELRKKDARIQSERQQRHQNIAPLPVSPLPAVAPIEPTVIHSRPIPVSRAETGSFHLPVRRASLTYFDDVRRSVPAKRIPIA